MQLFYNPNINEATQEFSFSKEESKHIMKVLRKSIGDVLHITNGNGFLFTAELLYLTPNKCTAQITSSTLQHKRQYKLHLAVAPTKMNDRYEWFLEKATEIGIDTITPLICDHSERKVVKLERFERILQAAMKQSLNCFMPKLNPATTFKAFMAQPKDTATYIAHCETQDKQSLKQVIKPQTDVTLLVGPEGDFSSKEIALALQNNCIPVTLGETRLRTETAAIVACHSVAFINEL